MRIYNKLVLDIDSGNILEEDSFEYSGPLALCGGGHAPAAPAPTPAENALTEAQLKQLQDQNKYRDEMEPFQLEAMGYKRDPTSGLIVKLSADERPASQILQDIAAEKSLAMAGYDTKGNKLSEEQLLANMTDSEKQSYQISKLTSQRQLDALEGKLPISPGLESELSSEELQATEMLNRKLGKDWALSTSGQSMMTKIKQKNNLVREEARRGMITETQGLAAAQANLKGMNNAEAESALNLSTTKLNQMAGFVTGVGTGMDNSMTMSSKLASERANKQNLAMQQWQQNQASSTSTTNAAITGGAMAAAAAAAYSDERLKNIIDFFKAGLEEILMINPIRWTWRSTGKEEVGLSAQNVQMVIPDAVITNAHGHLMVGFMPMIAALVNSVKELNKEIQTLKERV